MNKYHAKKVWVDNLLFASQAEATRYAALKLMERMGLIEDMKMQVPFELAPSVIIDGRKKPSLRYFADFTYMEHGKLVIEDVKGIRTPVFTIKKHLMKSVLGLDILETGLTEKRR